VRPEDGQASRISTIKIQIQDSCVFRQSPPPSFDIYKHKGDDEPEVVPVYKKGDMKDPYS
jgi:hypothetical protein